MGDLEIKIHSAEDLKNVKKISTMHAYAVAWIQKPGMSYSANERAEKAMTKPHQKGGRNPVWEETLTLPIGPDLSDLKNAYLLLRIYTASLILPDDTIVGLAVIPLDEIISPLDPSSGKPLCLTGTWQHSVVQVQRPSLRYQGTISFSVRITIPGKNLGNRVKSSSTRLPDSDLFDPCPGSSVVFNSSPQSSSFMPASALMFM